MRIDHIGYAVRRLDRAMDALKTLGFRFEPPLDDTARNVRLVFGENDAYRVELVCPLDRAKPSPVDGYLGKTGPAPYHICYRTGNLERAVEDLRAQGFRVVIPPEKAVAFEGRRVVFLMSLHAGLLEIVEDAASAE